MTASWCANDCLFLLHLTNEGNVQWAGDSHHDLRLGGKGQQSEYSHGTQEFGFVHK